MERCYYRSLMQRVTKPRGRDSGAEYSRDAVQSRARRRGIALVWTAIFLLTLVGIVGLSLDWGKAMFNLHQLQNAADAAALAGAQFVKFDLDGARWHARAISSENYADRVAVFLRDNPANDPNLDVVVGYWMRQTRTFTAFDPANPGPTNAVKVVDRRTNELPDGPLPLVFGSVFGKDSVAASRRAIAWSVGSTGAPGRLAATRAPISTALARSGSHTSGASLASPGPRRPTSRSWQTTVGSTCARAASSSARLMSARSERSERHDASSAG